MVKRGKYQFLDELRPEEAKALESDIVKRGVMVPVEVDEGGNVLDGYNRVEIAERHGLDYETIVRTFASEEEKKAHVIMLNLARRHLESWRWGLAFKKLLEVEGVERGQASSAAKRHDPQSLTIRDLAERVGVDLKTVEKRLQQADRFDALPAKKQEEVRTGKKKVEQAVREHKRERAAAELSKAAAMLPDELGIRRGDFRDVLADVEDGSVDLILTDPPYSEESLPLYADLGSFAARVLKPGGSLLCYTGQSILPRVLSSLGEHLRYWWTISLKHKHGGQRLPGKWVIIEWKPIVWFVKEKRAGREYVADTVSGSKPRKELHDWAQGVEEVFYLIEQLTDPMGLVVDPFAGSGSFGLACKELGRRFLGADLGE